MNLIDILTQPFQYSFMQRALIEVLIISIITGVIGTFLVLKNLAFISEALSHAVFPGIIVSFILKIDLIIGALAAGLLAVIGINITSSNKKISENTATGIMFSSAFALGVVLISFLKNYTGDLASFLIGNILGVSNNDLIISIIFAVFTLLIFALFYKQILITSFDSEFAKALGIKVKWIEFLFNVLVAVAIVIAIQAIGNVLVVALLIIPPATARLFNKRVPDIILYSVLITLSSSIVGLYLSYYLNVSAGASIVLTSSVIFFIFLAISNLFRLKTIKSGL